MARKYWKVVCTKRNGWSEAQVAAFWGEYAAESDRIFPTEGMALVVCDQLHFEADDCDGFAKRPEFDVEEIGKRDAQAAGFDIRSGVYVSPTEGDGSGNYYELTLSDDLVDEFDDFEPQTERDRNPISSVMIMWNPEEKDVELVGAYDNRSEPGEIERAIFDEFREFAKEWIAEKRAA